ncbi:MAG: hypothetical protein ABIT01_03875 [Thermoanaerobaculia bacterium]
MKTATLALLFFLGSLPAFGQEPAPLSAAPATLTIPAGASIRGSSGTFFHSDLWVFNRSFTKSQTVTARYRCFTGQTCGAGIVSFELAPRVSVLHRDVIGGLFGAPGTAGAMELSYDPAFGEIAATSRVYTPDQPAPTSGAAIPAFPATAAGTQFLFLGLSANGSDRSSGFRSNAGAYNPGTSPASVTFTLNAGTTGVVIGTPLTRTFEPNEAFQIDDVFLAAQAGNTVTTNALLLVSSSAPVFAYVTVIDNQSGDSIFATPRADSGAPPTRNLLANGSFDTGVGSWLPSGLSLGLKWAPEDANGAADSGSAVISNERAFADADAAFAQCIAVRGNTLYALNGKYRVPSGQRQPASASLNTLFFNLPGCMGALLNRLVNPATAVGAWTSFPSIPQLSPPIAVSARIELYVVKHYDGGVFQASFDDLSLLAPEPPPEPTLLTVPAAASLHGTAGTFFHSDLWVFNQSQTETQTVTARYRCFSGQACPEAPVTFSLLPRRSQLFSDVVATLFGAPETAGAIELSYDRTRGDVTATSRVYTPSLPAATNGSAIAAATASEARTRTLFLGLGANGGDLSGGFRSNAGAYNPNPAAVPVTFTLYDGEGPAVLGAPFTRTYGPNEAYQISDVFRAAGVAGAATANAYLLVTAPAPVFPYVTVIDNRSGDSVYVTATQDEAAP